VSDAQVTLLDDLPVDEDAFGGHRRIAMALIDLIRRENGGKAIALEGSWGSGKSSVIRMLEKEISASDDVRGDDDTNVLVFDAWSHEGDPLRRVFLEELTSLCTAEYTDVRKEYWEDRKKKEITGSERETHQKTTPLLTSRWPLLVLLFGFLYPVALVALSKL